MNLKKQFGFTLVELTIVIAIIGILATIIMVSYNGIQGRSRDAIRRNDVNSIYKALLVYYKNHGNYAQAGCGSGTGSGWYSHDYDGVGTGNKSISVCLTEPGYLNKELIDPSGRITCSGLTCHAYMKASCTAGTFIYAHLETLPQTTTDTDGTCQSTWDTSYGINYYVKVDL